jgi:hypothetical protein
MTSDDSFFFGFLPEVKSIPEVTKQLMDQLVLLPDRAANTFSRILDKIDSYMGRHHPSVDTIPFLAPPQDPTTLERLQGWISRNKVLVTIVLVGSGAIVTGVLVKKNARDMGRKRRAKRYANGQRKECVGMSFLET